MPTTAADIYLAQPDRAEIDDVLGQRLTTALGTLNEDGSIHLTYLMFLYEDGRFYLETASRTRKARNVAARRTASLLIHGSAANGRSLMVSCEGTARLIEVPDSHAVNHRIRAKYLLPDAVEGVDAAWGRFDDVSIEVTPQRWRSWTGDVLASTTEVALGRPYEEIWQPD
jgi:hypothetical protein